MTSLNSIKNFGVDVSLPFPRLRPPAFIVRLTTAFPGCNKRQILGFPSLIQPPCLRLRSVAKWSKPMGNLTRTTKHKSTISKIKEHYSKVVRCYFHVKETHVRHVNVQSCGFPCFMLCTEKIMLSVVIANDPNPQSLRKGAPQWRTPVPTNCLHQSGSSAPTTWGPVRYGFLEPTATKQSLSTLKIDTKKKHIHWKL